MSVSVFRVKSTELGCVVLHVQAYMSDALGVGAFLESSDGQVVLLKRGEHLAEAPGLWDIPGGHPEPQVMIGR